MASPAVAGHVSSSTRTQGRIHQQNQRGQIDPTRITADSPHGPHGVDPLPYAQGGQLRHSPVRVPTSLRDADLAGRGA